VEAMDLPTHPAPDVRMLRDDARVQQAFAAIKSQPQLRLQRGGAVRVEPRPIVRGHEIVMEDRLFTDAWPAGLRFLRDVDLSGVLSLAPDCDQVPAVMVAFGIAERVAAGPAEAGAHEK
jgi:hypothetical protein